MILGFLKERGLLLALVFIAAWSASLKFENHRLTGKLSQCEEGKARIVAAVKEADALAQAAHEDEERRSAANAQRSEASHDQDLERAAVAAGSYLDTHRIAAGGVRGQTARGESIEAPATAQGDGAGVPAEMPADAFVAVSSPDLQACTAAVTYAVAAHNWAATLPTTGGEDPPNPPRR
ncbi:MAG: hypothetical protein ACO1OX_07820 [Novosphingobium sp.]